jgi:hypothetical protein
VSHGILNYILLRCQAEKADNYVKHPTPTTTFLNFCSQLNTALLAWHSRSQEPALIFLVKPVNAVTLEYFTYPSVYFSPTTELSQKLPKLQNTDLELRIVEQIMYFNKMIIFNCSVYTQLFYTSYIINIVVCRRNNWIYSSSSKGLSSLQWFSFTQTKFRHLSLSLVSSSVSPWFVMLRLTPSIHLSLGLAFPLI